ncbi:hypothetical protein NM688_g1381 [Phlebia brevispora]|uniref:Uncharacterized protein n=1 Tax=Phlebia brevispora TaxID=194682 RepID=A0ACC1TBW0_9APHY|nr:hypothetical protein NM688_g1381 [Phlebia brevispora]
MPSDNDRDGVDEPQNLQILDSPLHIDEPVQLDGTPKTLTAENRLPLSAPSQWVPLVAGFAAGCAWIMKRYTPATYQRRLGCFALGYAVFTTDCFLASYSLTSRGQIMERIEHSLDEDIRKEKVSGSYLWWPIAQYGLPYDGWKQRERRASHLRIIRSRCSDEIIARYLERERQRDSETTLANRIAFKWHNSASSVETRACIEDIILAELDKSGIGSDHIFQHELRRCVAHLANTLECWRMSKMPKRVHAGFFYGSVGLSVVCTSPRILFFTLSILFPSLDSYMQTIVRQFQFWEAPLGYTNQDVGRLLHATYFSFIQNATRKPGSQTKS